MSRRPRPYGAVVAVVAFLALAGAQYCGKRARSATKPSSHCRPSAADLERAIYKRARNHRTKYRRWVAARLSKAVVLEGKRAGLPPLALLAVAEVESHYGHWVKGAAGELGIFQLIRWDVGPAHAWKHMPTDIKALVLKGRYLRALPRRGHWRASEFTKNIRIATYVAAHEIAMHVKNCRRRVTRFCRGRLFRSSHQKPLGPGVPSILARMGHYNSGTKTPRWGYLRKLGRAYRGLKREACK